MLNFPIRSDKKELLDRDDLPFEDIRQNLKELNTINRLLGGHAISVAGLKALMGDKQHLHIVEIGCGGGDNLFALQQFLIKEKRSFTLSGIDLKETCITYARSQYPTMNFICSDYKDVVFEAKPDILFCSLFCHHFYDDALLDILQWMNKNATLGFFINDLQRSRMAFISIRILTFLFSRSYLVKHDAPLSVLRGFLRRDWVGLFKHANISGYTLSWKWAFRYLIVKHD